MRFEEKSVILKNGACAILRSLEKKDAVMSIALNQNLSQSTDYMMKYPEEVNIDIEAEEQQIQKVLEDPKVCYFGLFLEEVLVATMGLYPVGSRLRTSHRCAIGAGVHSEYRGMGIGHVVLREVIEVAKQEGYEQMELDVVSENIAGKKLYTSFGFQKTGSIPHAFRMKNGKYYDFDIMVLNLK